MTETVSFIPVAYPNVNCTLMQNEGQYTMHFEELDGQRRQATIALSEYDPSAQQALLDTFTKIFLDTALKTSLMCMAQLEIASYRIDRIERQNAAHAAQMPAPQMQHAERIRAHQHRLGERANQSPCCTCLGIALAIILAIGIIIGVALCI